MRNLKRMLALVLTFAMLLPCFAGIQLTAAAATAFADAEEAADYVGTIQGFKIADLETYKAALALLDETNYADAYTRLSTGIAKLKNGYDYYDDFAVFGKYEATLDDSGLQPGDAFVATNNTTNYDYIFGGAYAQRLTGNIKSGDTLLVTAANTFPKAVSFDSFIVPSFHFGEWYYGQTGTRNWHADSAAKNDAALWKSYGAVDTDGVVGEAGASLQVTEKFNRVALKDSASGKASGENVTAFSVTVNPNNFPVIFFDYRDANNWSALTVNNAKTQIHFVTCTDGVLNYPAVFGLGARWEPTRSTNHTLVSTYYSWGTNYTSYYNYGEGKGACEFIGNFTLNFVWENDCYNVSMYAADGTVMPLHNGATVMALDEAKLGRKPQLLSNIIVSDIANSVNNTPLTTSNCPNGILSIAATYENYCSHNFSVEDVTVAQQKYAANCTNTAAYYSNCSLCGISAKGIDEDAIFYDPNGQLANCVYEQMSDAFVHWKQCPGCFAMDPENPKAAHNTDGTDGSCSVCGYVPNSLAVAQSAMALKGFYGEALEGYISGLALLEPYKDSTETLTETSTDTWQDAYNRLNGAVTALKNGYTYYDDLEVFGTYQSDMDDTGLTAGDKFGYTVNTSNYDVIFGGAYAQRLTEATKYTTVAGTYPYALNFSQFFIPIYHFQEWSYSTCTASNKDYADDNDSYSARYITRTLEDDERITEEFNWVALDTVKAGGDAGDVIDKFSVTVTNNRTVLILYNYIDQDNWSGIIGHGRGFRTYSCVDGVINGDDMNTNAALRFTYGSVFHIVVDKANYGNSEYDEYFTTADGVQILSGNTLQGHSKLDFKWDATEKCYKVSITHVESGLTFATDVALTSSISRGLTPTKLNKLWITQHNISTTKSSNFTGHSYSSIAVQYADPDAEPHYCVAQGDWISDSVNSRHYKLCSCGEIAVTEACSGTTLLATSESTHKPVCDTCQSTYGSEITCSAQGEIQTGEGEHWYLCACGNTVGKEACVAGETIHDGQYHWTECTVCGTEIAGSKTECTTVGGYSWNNNQHWATYACGVELPAEDCSGTGYVTENGQHQLICSVCEHTYGDKTDCSNTQWTTTETEHWKVCADCNVIIDSTKGSHDSDIAATYESNAFCSVCGYEHLGTQLEVDYLPTILGSKILTASKATDQKLKVYVDFTAINNAIENDMEIEEYGIIVSPLDDVLTKPEDSSSVDKSLLTALYTSSANTVKSTANANQVVDQRTMNLTISIPAANYGHRIALTAYVRIGGVNYYAISDNAGIGLSGGVLNTGVMRVMKAVLADETSNGYYSVIDNAAQVYFAEDSSETLSGTYADANEVAELVKKYAKGEIGTDHDLYADAKTAAIYVFYYCRIYYSAA